MSNEQKKNTSQSRRPRQSSTQKSKDGSDKKRSHSKPRVEWKLHPVAEEKDLASNILKNTDMDIDLDEINLLLRSVDKQTPAGPAADRAAEAAPEPVPEPAAEVESNEADGVPEQPAAPQPEETPAQDTDPAKEAAVPAKPQAGFPAVPVAAEADRARLKVVHAPKKKESSSSYKAAAARKLEKGGWQSNMFVLALILMLICSIVAGALAVINANTKELIQKYEEETRVAALQAIFPAAEDFEDVTEMIAGQADTERILAVYKAYAGGQLLGYCVDLETNGFSSSTPIELMVGSSPMNKVTAISVVNHGETPGIGAAVLEKNPEFMAQFMDSERPISFTPQITAVSGATITSNAVVSGLNDALRAVDLVRVAEADAQSGGGANG